MGWISLRLNFAGFRAWFYSRNYEGGGATHVLKQNDLFLPNPFGIRGNFGEGKTDGQKSQTNTVFEHIGMFPSCIESTFVIIL